MSRKHVDRSHAWIRGRSRLTSPLSQSAAVPGRSLACDQPRVDAVDRLRVGPPIILRFEVARVEDDVLAGAVGGVVRTSCARQPSACPSSKAQVAASVSFAVGPLGGSDGPANELRYDLLSSAGLSSKALGTNIPSVAIAGSLTVYASAVWTTTATATVGAMEQGPCWAPLSP